MYIINTNPLEQFQENLHDAAVGFREGRERRRKQQRAQEMIGKLQGYSPQELSLLGGLENPEDISKSAIDIYQANQTRATSAGNRQQDAIYKTNETITNSILKDDNASQARKDAALSAFSANPYDPHFMREHEGSYYVGEGEFSTSDLSPADLAEQRDIAKEDRAFTKTKQVEAIKKKNTLQNTRLSNTLGTKRDVTKLEIQNQNALGQKKYAHELDSSDEGDFFADGEKEDNPEAVKQFKQQHEQLIRMLLPGDTNGQRR